MAPPVEWDGMRRLLSAEGWIRPQLPTDLTATLRGIKNTG